MFPCFKIFVQCPWLMPLWQQMIVLLATLLYLLPMAHPPILLQLTLGMKLSIQLATINNWQKFHYQLRGKQLQRRFRARRKTYLAQANLIYLCKLILISISPAWDPYPLSTTRLATLYYWQRILLVKKEKDKSMTGNPNLGNSLATISITIKLRDREFNQ